MPCLTFVDLLATLAAFSLAFCFYASRPKGLPLPPGPKKLPVIGNVLDVPAEFAWETYRAWVQRFKSDIIHVKVPGMDIIILDSAEATYDLLDKKSATYSSRPRMLMACELMGWDWAMSLIPYNDNWRDQRKLARQEFGPTCTSRYYPQQREATQELLRRLMNTPDDFIAHVRHMAGQFIVSAAYGIDVQPSNDPYIELAEEAMDQFGAAIHPGAFLVDVIPALKYVPSWFPGAGFKRKAKEWRKVATTFVEAPYQAVKADMAKGTARPSFTSSCLQRIDESGDVPRQEYAIRGLAGTLYGAGSDTMVSALTTFFLAMVMHPEVQASAQKELDAVLGNGNLPDFGDELSLPYISAILKEVLRWKPVAPMGVPHRLDAEDTYKGYRIPAGSTCLANIWSIVQNEKDYPEPSQFKPERFMKDGKLNPEVKDPATAVFGFGRRICPGRFTAWSSMWLVVSSVLACFDISKAVDENGSIIEPSGEYKSSLVYSPLPFKCSIKPRPNSAINSLVSITG